MAQSFAEHMASKMDDSGDESGSDDYAGSLETAMQDLAKHLKDEDWAAAAQCFRDAQSLADQDDDEGAPDKGGPTHSALLLVPHGGK